MGLALLVVVLHAVVGILPDAPVVWVLTPDRLVLLVGLAAGLVAAPSPREWATWLDLPIVLLVAASAASAVASGQGWPVWRALLTGVMTCYLAVGLMRRHPSSWTLVTGSALVACAVTGLTALHQWADDVPTGFCRAGLAAGRELCSDPDAMVRVTGTFGNPNVLAAALVLLLPVAWAGATSLPTSSARLVGYAVVVLGYVAVLLTWPGRAWLRPWSERPCWWCCGPAGRAGSPPLWRRRSSSAGCWWSAAAWGCGGTCGVRPCASWPGTPWASGPAGRARSSTSRCRVRRGSGTPTTCG